MEEHLNADKHSIQHPVEAAVVTTTSDLAYKLIPLSLEHQSVLQQKGPLLGAIVKAWADKCNGRGASSGEATLCRKMTKKTRLLYEISACENIVQQLETELNQRESSIKLLLFHMHELDQKRTSLRIELQQLYHQIDETNSSDAVRDLIQSLESLKALERKESALQPHCEQTHSDAQSEMLNLEKDISIVNERQCDLMNLDQSLIKSSNKLRLAKRELAAKLRAILLLKRQIDDVPAQTELIQYERRFSELYVQIQEKHSQTRKHYATYNTLLEIKELMLKETSLLNSIDLQFQDAMTSTTGRSKLVNSMDAIVKGTQQKLEKVQSSLLVEQKYSESLKEKYMTAIAEQRHFSSLLKSFQDWGIPF
ncbi:coiled-coil domain-containing protein 93 isoform X2 [Phoenix dactylifera]|uniref:Coiled-coil domain-containing protein 93 isoform X2 n=1 Tax=Phoenix dactylifera TaxID=42345 RepID=A0A8B9AMT3_PHODC|nr:coiled-coil domain-containing protein 93 isoform X2 [Phoenix dactylifera]